MAQRRGTAKLLCLLMPYDAALQPYLQPCGSTPRLRSRCRRRENRYISAVGRQNEAMRADFSTTQALRCSSTKRMQGRAIDMKHTKCSTSQ